MPAWVAPVVGAAIAGAVGYKGAKDTNKINQREAQKNRDFQREMRNTQWQAAVEDMRAAGINPALAYQQGPNSAPGGSATAPAENPTNSALNAIQQRKAIALLEAQIEKAKGEAKSAKAAGNLDAWRTGAMLRLKMDWDGDGQEEQLAQRMLLHEFLQSRYNMEQTRNMARISGLGGSLAGNLTGPVSRFSRMAGRGWGNIASGLEGLEGMSLSQITKALERLRSRFRR